MWLPVVDAVAYLLILMGAVFVILGRKAFGTAHGRNVVISLALVLAAIGAVLAGFIVIALQSVASSSAGSAVTQSVLVSAFQTALLLEIVVAVLLGLAYLLFTLSLQTDLGRILLFAAYGSYLALAVAIDLIVSPLVPGIVANAFGSGLSGVAAAQAASQAFAGEVQPFGYLGAIPAALFAIATYIAWSRMRRGEIPPRPGPPTAAAPVPRT